MHNWIFWFLACYFPLFFGAAFIWPSLRTYRQTGINPLTFGKTDSAHDFIGRWFKLVLALIPIVIVCYGLGAGAYAYLLPAAYLQLPLLQYAGAALCLLALGWTITAQAHMGRAWRIGLDDQNPTQLVRSGLFGISRNPVFVGMNASLLGLFLLAPNALSLLVLVTGYLLIQIQVRLEEAFLAQRLQQAYTDYQAAVPRWLF